MKTKRITWIDTGKGIGLFLIILGHMLTPGTPLSSWIFSFHVPLFFFLSGYVTKLNENNLSTSFKKIILGLIIPYFVFVFIGFLISFMIPIWRPDSLKLIFFQVFYTVNPEILHIGQIWFLVCLAIVELLFVIISLLDKRMKFILLAFMVVSPIISFALSNFSFELNINNLIYSRVPWKLDSALMGFFFFVLGYFFRKTNVLGNLYKYSLTNLLILITLFLFNIYISVKLNPGVNLAANYYGSLFYYLVASCNGILVSLFVAKFFQNNSLLNYFGRNSLSIFSLHSFVLYFFAFLLSYIFSYNFNLMTNIPLAYSLIGLLPIVMILLLITKMYNNTIGVLLFIINAKVLRSVKSIR